MTSAHLPPSDHHEKIGGERDEFLDSQDPQLLATLCQSQNSPTKAMDSSGSQSPAKVAHHTPLSGNRSTSPLVTIIDSLTQRVRSSRKRMEFVLNDTLAARSET
ncbi:MAG: hypothetical protein MHMPM18_002254 [Marteilia pararefringens]